MTERFPSLPAPRRLAERHDYLSPGGPEIRELAQASGGGLVHATLPSDSTAAALTHSTVEEVWYVLSGKGELWRRGADGEEVTDLTPGTSVVIPPGVEFQWRNRGADPVSVLIVDIPRWPGPEEASRVQGPWTAADRPPTG
jgi:mannose-6-phosphate isomerase-like protein (cupin superfamily)